MKLRYWYKIDHKKQPVPGSNVRRKSRPGASHQWKEILDPCCNPLGLDCTCGPRYFIQLDGRGKPVDGTLIKRVNQPKNNFPEGTDGNRLYEIDWKSVCCTPLIWNFINTGATGSIVIEVNGTEVINSTITDTGSIIPSEGDEITITISSDGTNSLVITGGQTYSSTSQPATYSFIWNDKKTIIASSITGI